MHRENKKKFFYQWELDQRLIVTEECSVVQFYNGTLTEPLGSEVKEENGVLYACVPNVFLQTAAKLHAYAWNGKSFTGYCVFDVKSAPKPTDYIYTETETYTVAIAVHKALEEAEASGAFKGDPGFTPKRGVDYYTEADKTEIVDAVLAALPKYNGEVEEV